MSGKNVLTLLVFQFILLHAYEVSDRFLGLWGISHEKAHFGIESPFDFRGCSIKADIHKLNRIHFDHNSCFIKKDKSYGALVCTKDKEPDKRCIKRSHIRNGILKNLNRYATWYVSGVALNDTLSVRSGPGVNYEKIFELAPHAKGMHVLAVKMNGTTTWYKVKYQGITGWVSSRYLNCREK